MATALPPYDIIIFFVVWFLVVVVYATVVVCRRTLCAPRPAAAPTEGTTTAAAAGGGGGGGAVLMLPEPVDNNNTVGGVPPRRANRADEPAAPSSSHANGDIEMHPQGPNGGPKEVAPALPPAQESTPPWPTGSPTLNLVIRMTIAAVVTFVVAYLLTMIIMAILGAAGLVSLFVFSPETASSCTPSCTYTTQDGLYGWVDESCCTYSPTGLGEYYDVWLDVKDSNGVDLGFVVHGWLMINRTAASPTDRPVALLYNHGSGGNVASGYRIMRYQFLLSQGNIAIFSFDFPGYGKSTGSTTATTIMQSALGAADWFNTFVVAPMSTVVSPSGSPPSAFPSPSAVASTAAARMANSSVFGSSMSSPTVVQLPADFSTINLQNMTLLGRSMGGGVATYVLRQARSNATSPHALILQSVWTNLEDISTSYFPMFGWVWAQFAKSQYADFSNTANLGRNWHHCTYHYHSRSDEWIDFSEGQALESNVLAPNVPASCSMFVVADRAAHTQPLTNVERATLRVWIALRRNEGP